MRALPAGMEQILNAANRAANSPAVINTFLAGLFGVLAARSYAQQRIIEGLEVEKDSLVKTNKSIKSTIWDWKQKLYAEAEANPLEALVPLSTLKSIYGEVVTTPTISDDTEDEQSPSPRIMI